jgi:NADH:ubiquinone oxidoreductase subunit D/NADH:ubiquinone oxidoreductase subunit C
MAAAPDEDAVVETLQDIVGELVMSVTPTGGGRVVAMVGPELLADVLTALKERAGCRDLMSIAAVDLTHERAGIELVHHFTSKDPGCLVEVVTHLEGPEEEGEVPPTAVVPSATQLWPAAKWLERETWELSGVVFEGHPDLRRLLLPSNWVGHPLRGDEARNRTVVPEGVAGAEQEVDKGPDWTPVGLPNAFMGGALELKVRTQKGRVTAARVGVGSLHRGVEGLSEGRTWDGVLPLAARTAARSSIHWQVACASAVERLMDLEVPQRGAAIRVALLELERIADHMLSHATVLELLGCRAAVARIWADRELVMDVMQVATGQRLVHDAVQLGGVGADVPRGWTERLGELSRFLEEEVKGYVREVEALEPWGRLEGLAPVHPDTVPGWGLTGPLARAAGVPLDARTDGRSPCYGGVEVQMETRDSGDALARAEVRLLEIASSARVLRQVSGVMPGGRVRQQPPSSVPPGRSLGVVEDPRGELHCMVVSDGRERPRRVRFRSPDFAHVAALGDILIDCPSDAIPLAVASLDICVGGVDR